MPDTADARLPTEHIADADVGQHESLRAIAFAPVDPSIQAGGVREFRGPLR